MECLGNRSSQSRSRCNGDVVRECEPQTRYNVPVHCQWFVNVEPRGDFHGVDSSAGLRKPPDKECHVFRIDRWMV